MAGLIGKKLGMTQVFNKDGDMISVTVLQAGPCVLVFKKLPQKDGYAAIQLGFGEIDAKKVSKPYGGHFSKKNQKVYTHLKEMRTTHVDAYNPGDILTVAPFQMGDLVDVVGVSKGKGFQGVIKRHHFGGNYASHGCSVSHRSAGSIGQRTFPGKVFKGKKMAGRMGGERTTVRHLQIVGVEAEQNLLLVHGAVPGPNRGLVEIHPCSDSFEKRFLEGKKNVNA